MVRKARTERAEPSKAVRDLREAVGYSQADLAHVLQVSLGTVARWETSNPPGGDYLMLLYAVGMREANELLDKLVAARDKKGPDLTPAELNRYDKSWEVATRFLAFFLEELVTAAPIEFFVHKLPHEQEPHGFLLVRADGWDAISGAESLLVLIKALKREETRAIAVDAIKQLDAVSTRLREMDRQLPQHMPTRRLVKNAVENHLNQNVKSSPRRRK
jgi:transcriptional regulator with XRE-family HTH domain